MIICTSLLVVFVSTAAKARLPPMEVIYVEEDGDVPQFILPKRSPASELRQTVQWRPSRSIARLAPLQSQPMSFIRHGFAGPAVGKLNFADGNAADE